MANLLTAQDIDILFEALDIWEEKQTTGDDIIADLVSGLFTGNRPQADEFSQKIQDSMKEQKGNALLRKKTSALLKAKLVQMQDSLIAQEIGAELKDRAQKDIDQKIMDALTNPDVLPKKE